jgi:F-type H+-transporting ATPase subunit gamma
MFLHTKDLIIIYFFRLYSDNIAVVANEVGRKPPTFLDASKVANQLVQLDYNSGKIIYNRFKYFLSLLNY